MDNSLSSLDGAPNMNKICRTCLLENEEMEPIFGDIPSNEFAFSYQAMLMSCANLQIQENDGLPSNICHQCIADVSQAFTFKNQSEQSQLALERYIGKYTEGINTNVNDNILENQDTNLNSDMSEDGEYVEIYQETENDAAENIKVITARPFKCDFCPKYFKNQYEYQRHCNIHLGIKFPCRNCKRQFTQESARNLHMRKVHKIRVKKESIPDVLVTQEQKKRETLYNVPLPTSKPPQQKDSNAEPLLPHVPMSLDCQFCMKHFKNQYELLRHTNIHTGVKFRCLCCDKKFTQVAARNKHIRKTHGLSVKKKQKTVQDMTNVLYLERENDYIVESNTEDVIPALDEFQNGNLLRLTNNNDYVSVEVIDTDNNEQLFDLTNVKEEYVDANCKDSLQNDNLADPNHQWNCEICSKNVSDKAALIIHLQEHMSLSSTFPPQIEERLDFQCLQCPEQFKTNLSLNAHMHSHKKTKYKANGNPQHLKHRTLTHHCHMCNKRFKYHSKLIAHLKVHKCNESVNDFESVIDENNLGFRCAYCYKIFTTTNDLRAHVSTHKGQKRADVFTCTYCNIGYPTQGLFINHTMLYHRENLVKKGGLGDVLSNESVLINKNVQSLDVRRIVAMGENHKTNYIIQDSSDNDCFITLSENKEQDRLVMDNLASFQCDICLICFENREKLMAHKIDSHVTRPGAFDTIDKKFTCGVCGRGFTKHVYMKRHMLVHTNVKSVECSKPGCPKLLPNNGLLMDRKDCQDSAADESTEVSGKLLCTKCGDELTSKRKLSEHLKRHFNQRDFPCTFCEKRFFTKSTLVVHTRIHTNEKPYMCQYCGKGFAQYGDMKLHVRWHTGERPYQCNHCDRRFTTSGNRKDHEATHFTDKKYQCSQCNKTFKAQRTLKIHYRQHTGEKPYMCEICGRAFRRKHHVRIHMKVHGETVTETLPKVLPLFVTDQDILFG